MNKSIQLELYPILINSEMSTGLTYGIFGYATLTDNIFLSLGFILFIGLIVNFNLNLIGHLNCPDSSKYFLILNLIILFWGGTEYDIFLRIIFSILAIEYFNKLVGLNKFKADYTNNL